jgi:hypothetical protein
LLGIARASSYEPLGNGRERERETNDTSRVVKNGSVVSILRVLTKRGGDDEKTGGVSTEIR